MGTGGVRTRAANRCTLFVREGRGGAGEEEPDSDWLRKNAPSNTANEHHSSTTADHCTTGLPLHLICRRRKKRSVGEERGRTKEEEPGVEAATAVAAAAAGVLASLS